MAKSILLILTLALIAASVAEYRGAFAATDDGDNLAQRQEVLRVFSNPASVVTADSETVHRMARVLKKEIGPLGPVFKAIRAMPKTTAADVRAKEEASDAAMELLFRHFRQLAPNGCAKKDHDL